VGPGKGRERGRKIKTGRPGRAGEKKDRE